MKTHSSKQLRDIFDLSDLNRNENKFYFPGTITEENRLKLKSDFEVGETVKVPGGFGSTLLTRKPSN